MTKSLTQAKWSELLHQDFRTSVDGQYLLTVQLTSVTGFKHRPDPGREAYSLIFCGPLKPVLTQRIFRLMNNQIGEADIVLVPIGPHKEGMGYEAVF